MHTTQKEIGKKIQEQRKARGWTQEALAERSGLHPTYIGGVERGERNATIDSFCKIAEAFGISLSDLFKLDRHDLEKLFIAPADDIMLAILKGFRAQVDVKGKLPELYLFKYLKHLTDKNLLDGFEWSDKDGLPDFKIIFNGAEYVAECKNLRSGQEGIYKKNPSYKVEVQKTRNSKDGSNTRSYPVDNFDLLAVCMFNQTGKWDFYFIATEHLNRTTDERFLTIFQPVPFNPTTPWEKNILTVLAEIARQRE